MEKINEQLEEIIKKVLETEEAVTFTKETELEAVGLDSLQVIKIICECEKVMDIEFNDEDLDPTMYITYGDLYLKVESLIA